MNLWVGGGCPQILNHCPTNNICKSAPTCKPKNSYEERTSHNKNKAQRFIINNETNNISLLWYITSFLDFSWIEVLTFLIPWIPTFQM